MKPTEREDWLISRMEKYTYFSTMDQDDVSAYIKTTGAKHKVRMIGPADCPIMHTDLRRLMDRQLVKRSTAPTSNGSWAYHYRLAYLK